MRGCVQWNMFYISVILWEQGLQELKTVECTNFLARLASFGHLGPMSDLQISSKLQNGINDPKGLENKVYTMMKGRETFLRSHQL